VDITYYISYLALVPI